MIGALTSPEAYVEGLTCARVAALTDARAHGRTGGGPDRPDREDAPQGLRTALCVEDVLLDRGLRFPTGRWGLSAVIWGRSKSWTEIAVPDADRLAPGAEVRQGAVAFKGAGSGRAAVAA